MFFALLLVTLRTFEALTVENCIAMVDEDRPSGVVVAEAEAQKAEIVTDADQVVATAFDNVHGSRKFKALADKRYDAWFAAVKADPNAMFLVGMCRFAGVRGPQDQQQATRLFVQAAKQGSPHAHVMIGRFAEQSGSKDALMFYGQAAKKKFAWGEYRLGLVYSEGKIVAVDNDLAFQWILAAAEHGLAAAQADVGSRIENGVGTAKDPQKAFDWYQKSAAQDDAIGHLNLGVCYLKGIGTPKDASKAEHHLKAAAELGDQAVRKLVEQYLAE